MKPSQRLSRSQQDPFIDGQDDSATPKRRVTTLQWLLLVLIVLLVIASVWMNTSTRESPTAAVDMSGPTPPPWFHDVENNRHWDPGHGHWHDGPPPAHATQPPSALMAPLRAPEPWEYDAANNRHWHPGHNHWHAGPPPQMPETTPEVPSETTPEAPAGAAGQWLPDAPPETPPTP